MKKDIRPGSYKNPTVIRPQFLRAPYESEYLTQLPMLITSTVKLSFKTVCVVIGVRVDLEAGFLRQIGVADGKHGGYKPMDLDE
ncbi:hypothetical protein RUND412_009552, partial [Rhizina undulata]